LAYNSYLIYPRDVRKHPQQQRSRAMVERIISSGRMVLVRDGYERFSTNPVAVAAQISPGSLYQYFPDKASIIQVIVDRYLDDVSESVAAALASQLGKPADELAFDAVDALLAAVESDPGLVRVVAEELPGRQTAGQRRALERRIRELVMATLTAVRGDLDRDMSTMAWVVVQAMQALVIGWITDPPNADRQAVTHELAWLAYGYLMYDKPR